MSGSLTLHEFEKAAYTRTGQPESFEETATFIDELGASALQHGHEAVGTARDALWEMGDGAIRRVLAVGSIAAGSHSWRSMSNRNNLYFGRADDFGGSVHATNDSQLAITSLVAVGEEYRNLAKYVPGGLAYWAAPLIRNADEQQQQSITDALAVLKFSCHHTDSEDMSDPHEVSMYVHDESLPLSFRQRLLDLAHADAENTSYKPGVWQSQLKVTLHNLSRDTSNSLRFVARKHLGLPESDDEYQAFLDRQAAEAARLREAQTAEREATVTAKRAEMRSLISEALSRRTLAIAPQ